MPKKKKHKIIIDGIIGWDVYGSKIRNQFADAESGAVEIELSSPGGFVYDGLEIFNIIRNYSREVAPVTIRLMGLAASMASYIALAGDELIAEDNAIFMIHNAWVVAIGDYRELNKTADHIERLTNLLAKEYAKKSGKTLKSIRELMDSETYYYGDEALDAGFVDEIIETDSDSKDKDESIILAQGRIKNSFEAMRKSENHKDDLSKAAALLPKQENTKLSKEELDDIVDDIINEPKQEIKMEVKIMPKLKELLSQNPEAKIEYDENIQAAKDIGEKNVQDRIDAVIPFLNNENYKGMENLTAEVLSGKTEISALKSAIAVIDNMRETEKSKAAKDDTIDNPDIPALKNDLPKESGEIESEIDFRAEIARKKGVKV